MKRATLVSSVIAGLFPAAAAEAAGVEIAAYVGKVNPTWSQSFAYSPTIPDPFPGVSIRQNGSFQLDATGGLAIGGGITLFLADAFGIEARLDSADVSIESEQTMFRIDAMLPSPLPPLSADVELPPAVVDLERVRPLSLNLRLRIPSPVVSLSISGGVSLLPDLNVSVTQPVTVGAAGLITGVDLATLPLRASSTPEAEGSRVGANAGVALQLNLGPNLSLVGEARGFLFPEQRLDWSSVESTGTALERELVSQVRDQLPAIEFTPGFVNASVGLAIAF